MIEHNHNILEEMNAIQVKERVNMKTIAILVIGSCENHGDHLPFGSDFLVPFYLARSIAKKLKNVIVLPPIPYGLSIHHIDYQMTMSLSSETVVRVVEDLFTSLIRNGINRIVIINGHDGNIAPLELAARTIKDRYPETVIACLESWWTLIGQKTKGLFQVWDGLGHAGEAETSAVLAIRSDLVEMQNAPEQTLPKLPSDIRIYWKFNELTNTGSTGAARKATIKKGRKLLRILESIVLSFVNDMEKHDWKYGVSDINEEPHK
jgi:creatinine amidohydrolase